MADEAKLDLKKWLKSFVSAGTHKVVRDLTTEEERLRYPLKDKPSSANGDELYKYYFDVNRQVNLEVITQFITWFNQQHGLQPTFSFDLPYRVYRHASHDECNDTIVRYVYEQLRVITNILSIFDAKFKLDTLMDIIDIPQVDLARVIKRYDDYMLPRIAAVAENIYKHERFTQKLTEARETHVVQRLNEYRVYLVLGAFISMYEKQEMEDFEALRSTVFHTSIHYGLEFELVMVNKKIGKLLPCLRRLVKY